MAHKKAGGSTRNGRDSESKRLGVKAYGGRSIITRVGSCSLSNAGSLRAPPPVVSPDMLALTTLDSGARALSFCDSKWTQPCSMFIP